MAISKRLRFEILKRDGFACRYCHRDKVIITVDHVIPQALGGSDHPSNLVASCDDCNAGKTSSLPGGTTVEDASENLVRWSLAMKCVAAGAKANHDAGLAYRETFESTWNAWVYERDGKRYNFDLPKEWQERIEALRDAGLPEWTLKALADGALGTRGITNRFEHFMTAAWKWVAEFQSDVRAEYGSTETLASVAQGVWSDTFSAVYGEDAPEDLLQLVAKHARMHYEQGYRQADILSAAQAGGACRNAYFGTLLPKRQDLVARIADAVRVWRWCWNHTTMHNGSGELEPATPQFDAFEFDVETAIDELNVEQSTILAAAARAGYGLEASISAYIPELDEHYTEYARQFEPEAKV